MRGTVDWLSSASQATSYLLGGLVVALALAAYATSMSLTEIATWAQNVLGVTFTLLLGALVFVTLLAWVKITQLRQDDDTYQAWLTTGVQAANGVATGRSLRPVKSIEKSCGAPPLGCRKNMITRPLGAHEGPSTR